MAEAGPSAPSTSKLRRDSGPRSSLRPSVLSFHFTTKIYIPYYLQGAAESPLPPEQTAVLTPVGNRRHKALLTVALRGLHSGASTETMHLRITCKHFLQPQTPSVTGQTCRIFHSLVSLNRESYTKSKQRSPSSHYAGHRPTQAFLERLPLPPRLAVELGLGLRSIIHEAS